MAQIRSNRFLLDESLPPLIASVLQQVGYPITSSQEQQMEGVPDEVLIPWMGNNELAWITKDDAARTEHGALIQSARISVVWVRGLERRNRTTVRNNISVKDLHRMLTMKLDEISEDIFESRGPRYFRLFLGGRGPTLERFRSLDQVGTRRRDSGSNRRGGVQ